MKKIIFVLSLLGITFLVLSVVNPAMAAEPLRGGNGNGGAGGNGGDNGNRGDIGTGTGVPVEQDTSTYLES